MADTDDMIILHFDNVLKGREARALRRLADFVNRNEPVRKSENNVALGLLRYILEEMKEEHNCIIGVVSTRKE